MVKKSIKNNNKLKIHSVEIKDANLVRTYVIWVESRKCSNKETL